MYKYTIQELSIIILSQKLQVTLLYAMYKKSTMGKK